MIARRVFALVCALVLLPLACIPADDTPAPAPDAACPNYYVDHDGDGHGDPLRPLALCFQAAPPPLYVASHDDCDDRDRRVAPGSPERCDGRDDDCDGAIETVCPDECTAVFRVANQHSYMVCTGPRSWDDARRTCEAEGLDLVHIDDALENTFVRAAVAGEVHLGGQFSGQAWRWVDDGQVFWTVPPTLGTLGGEVPGIYAAWALDAGVHPNIINGATCTIMRDDGGWTNGSPAIARVFVCERN